MRFDMPSCGGCRTCELVCSYHHLGQFAPAASSLKILEKPEGSGYLVLLKEEADGSGPACDGCGDLDVAWCLQYCRELDDLYKILQEFEANRLKSCAVLNEGALDGGR
jgi:Fe-S-cluster-containing hydrogenase component 2